MFKRVLMAAAVAAAVSAPAFADVSITGSAEMDMMVGTNRGTGTELYQEIATVINFDGSEKLDSGDTLKWRVAQKVSTDWQHDGLGQREAWIGYAGGFGELRFGRQFTNAYLTLDWPYGVNGSGNMVGDLGGQDTWFGDAVSYFSPDFGGFNFTAQYKIGSSTAATAAGKPSYALNAETGVIEKKDGAAATEETNTWGYDLGLNGSFGPVALNAGYQFLNDRAHLEKGLANGDGNPNDWLNKVGAGNETTTWFVGGRASFGDFNLRALYRSNEVKYSGVKASADQWLIGGGWASGKHNVRVSYQQLMDAEVGGKDVDSGVQQVAGQYNYSISKNSVAFVQARYHMYDSAASIRFDGATTAKDNSARITVGTWTGF